MTSLPKCPEGESQSPCNYDFPAEYTTEKREFPRSRSYSCTLARSLFLPTHLRTKIPSSCKLISRTHPLSQLSATLLYSWQMFEHKRPYQHCVAS